MPRQNRKRRSSARPPLREVVRAYSSRIFAGIKLGDELELRLKRESRAVIGYLLSHAPVHRIRLLGTPRPKKLSDFGGLPPTATTGDPITEMKWALAVLCHHQADVGKFVQVRAAFERALVLGDLQGAEAARGDMIARLGHSWWTVETDFLLAQRRGGLEGNRKTLQGYQERSLPAWVRCVSYFYSTRVEDDFPVAEFDEACDILKPEDDADQVNLEGRAYLRFRVNFHRFQDPSLLCHCLSTEESHSIADRYTTFINALKLLLASGDPALKAGANALALEASRRLADPALALMAALVDPSRAGQTEEGAALLPILHDYTEGRYEQAHADALAAIARHPGCFEFYDVAARAAVRGGGALANPFGEGTIARAALDAVHSVLSLGVGMRKSLARLHKLAYQLDPVPLGPQIYSFVQNQGDGLRTEANDPFSVAAASVLTPRLSTAIPANETALAYLARLDQLHPGNAAIRLFLATRGSVAGQAALAVPPGLPETRAFKYNGYVMERLGRHGDALEAYKQLDALSGGNALLKSDATSGLFRCSLRLGRVTESAAVLAEAAAANPRLVAVPPLREILSRYAEHRDRDSLQGICWPVLHCVAQREGVSGHDLDMLHDALDDFLDAWGLQKPSDLRGISDNFPAHCLVYVLRYLCTPDVLDSSIWYSTQEEVEAERIRICEWLVDLDPGSRASYVEEIAALTSRASMREMTHKVGHSKIFVDTDGIKAALPPAFLERVRRCIAYSALNSDLRRSLGELSFNAEDRRTLNLIFVDGGYRLFVLLFNDLKQMFLSSNEYGLDSNLSQRIRHGTLLGELRAQFEQHRLVTQKDTSGAYRPNDHWLLRLGLSGGPVRETADAALRRLSADIDSLAQDVRARWVQVKGPANENEGMFDYDFDELRLNGMYQALNPHMSEASFIDFMFEALWQRTEEDLAAVRGAISGRLKDLLFGALDRCQHSLEAALPGDRLAEFRAAVTASKTTLSYGLGALSEWFRIDHAQRTPPFRLAEIADAILATVAKYCGPCKLDATRDIRIARRLQGRLFRPFWDLLFILLDNIAKHSGLPLVPVRVEGSDEDGLTRVTVRNSLGPLVDRAELSRRGGEMSGSRDLDSEGDLIRREGGSGFVKVHKILRYDFRCSQYDVRFAIGADVMFEACIAIPSRGLYDEGASHR